MLASRADPTASLANPKSPASISPATPGVELALLAVCFLKDSLGTALPAALKKPFDLIELFENKLSALVAAAAFVPLVVSVFRANSGGDGAMLGWAGLAMIDPSPLYNVIAVGIAIFAFFIVWMAAHAVNILIVLSPFTTLDAALKSARLFVLSTVPVTSFLNPYFGAAWALVVILIAWFLAGWSFRLTVFGTVFALDFLTLRRKRFTPDKTANWMFLARAIERVPVRTCGCVSRDEQGRFVLRYRPWLVLPSRTLTLPAGQYAIGRDWFYPELLLIDGKTRKTICTFSPRYHTHEEALSQIYGLGEIHDVGLRAAEHLTGFASHFQQIARPRAVSATRRASPDFDAMKPLFEVRGKVSAPALQSASKPVALPKRAAREKNFHGTQRPQFRLQISGHLVRVRRVPQPGARLQHADPRRGDKTHLARQLARLLAAIIELAGQFQIEKDHRVAHERPVFRAAEAEHIDSRLPGEFLGRDSHRRHRVGEARAIHVDLQPVLFGLRPDRLDFLDGVHRAQLGGLREADCARFRIMDIRAAFDHALDAGRIDLSVRAGQQQHFRAVGKKFRRSAFVRFHVRGLVAQNAVIRLAHGRQRE